MRSVKHFEGVILGQLADLLVFTRLPRLQFNLKRGPVVGENLTLLDIAICWEDSTKINYNGCYTEFFLYN
jgi:hypothetical protein